MRIDIRLPVKVEAMSGKGFSEYQTRSGEALLRGLCYFLNIDFLIIIKEVLKICAVSQPHIYKRKKFLL